jgi:hypothetical protein
VSRMKNNTHLRDFSRQIIGAVVRLFFVVVGRIDAQLSAGDDFNLVSRTARNEIRPIGNGASSEAQSSAGRCHAAEIRDNYGFLHGP